MQQALEKRFRAAVRNHGRGAVLLVSVGVRGAAEYVECDVLIHNGEAAPRQ